MHVKFRTKLKVVTTFCDLQNYTTRWNTLFDIWLRTIDIYISFSFWPEATNDLYFFDSFNLGGNSISLN